MSGDDDDPVYNLTIRCVNASHKGALVGTVVALILYNIQIFVNHDQNT